VQIVQRRATGGGRGWRGSRIAQGRNSAKDLAAQAPSVPNLRD
jgi:hypothetical protein